MNTPLNTSAIRDNFLHLLSGLTEKEQSVIIRRVGINGEKETLQSIGNSYDITRERVRQIEDVGIKKIGRIVRSTELVKLQEVGEKILSLSGGLMTKDQLISAVMEEIKIDKSMNE